MFWANSTLGSNASLSSGEPSQPASQSPIPIVSNTETNAIPWKSWTPRPQTPGDPFLEIGELLKDLSFPRLQGTPNLLKLCQQLVPGIHIFVQASSCRVQGAAIHSPWGKGEGYTTNGWTWKLCEKLSNLMVLKKHVPYQDCHLEGYAVCPLNGQPKDLQSFFTAQAWRTEGPLRHSAAAPFRPCGCWTPGVLGWSETSARAEIQIHGPKDFQIWGFPKMVVP